MKAGPKGKPDPLVASISPGVIVATEFLEPLGITAYRLAAETGMLNLQSHYDLEKATRDSYRNIKARVKPLQAA